MTFIGSFCDNLFNFCPSLYGMKLNLKKYQLFKYYTSAGFCNSIAPALGFQNNYDY